MLYDAHEHLNELEAQIMWSARGGSTDMKYDTYAQLNELEAQIVWSARGGSTEMKPVCFVIN
jgi:hypothetical protein